MILTPELEFAIRIHADSTKERECCGLIVCIDGKNLYRPCVNQAGREMEFRISGEDLRSAEDSGELVAVVHSHPYIAPEPTMPDKVAMEDSELPWVIVNWPTGEIRIHHPTGFKAPLVGRVFCHGVLDCFSLLRDYYKDELGIEIADYERDERWWEKGQNLYLEGYEKAGFVRVDKPQKHDICLMQLHSSVPNHGAIFLGDGTILQHLQNRLSGIYHWGGFWQRSTTHVFRHRSLL